MAILNATSIIYVDDSLSIDGRFPIVAEVWCEGDSDLPTRTQFTKYVLCTGSKALTPNKTYVLSNTTWIEKEESPFKDVYTKSEVDALISPITDDITSLDGRVDAVETTNSNQDDYIYHTICYSDLNYLDYKLSANLFDKENSQIYCGTLNTTDKWTYAGTSLSSTTVRIPCKPDTTYYISIGAAGTIFRVSECSSEQIPNPSIAVNVTRIKDGTSDTGYTFTTSSTTKYIIFQGSSTDISNWFETLMVSYGDTAQSYVPYSKTSVRNGATTAGNGYICQDIPINLHAGNYVWKMKRDGNTTTTISVKDASDNVLYTATRDAGVNDITQPFTISSDAAKVSIYAGYSVNYSDNMIFEDLTTSSNRGIRQINEFNEIDDGQIDRLDIYDTTDDRDR